MSDQTTNTDESPRIKRRVATALGGDVTVDTFGSDDGAVKVLAAAYKTVEEDCARASYEAKQATHKLKALATIASKLMNSRLIEVTYTVETVEGDTVQLPGGALMKQKLPGRGLTITLELEMYK